MASKYITPVITFNDETKEWEKFDADNIVIRSATSSKKDITQYYVNYGVKKVDPKGKEVIVKPRFILPPRPARMYSKYNEDYDSTTNKLTLTLNKEREPEEDHLIIEVLNEIDIRQKELFTEWVQDQNKENKAFKKVDWSSKDTQKKFGDLLFYYEEDKNGNEIENPEKVQKFSVKIETKYFRTVGISFLKRKVTDEDGEVEEQDWPKTIDVIDPKTKEKKIIKTTGKLKWNDFKDTLTMSSITIEFDSVFVRIEKGVDLAAFRRTYLVNNAIADFIDRGDGDFVAEAAQEIYGNNEKVNPNLAEKLSKLSEYQFGGDDSDSSSEEEGLKASEEKKEAKTKTKKSEESEKKETKTKTKNKKSEESENSEKDGDSSPNSDYDDKESKNRKKITKPQSSENSEEEIKKPIRKTKTRRRREVPSDEESED